MLKRLGLGFAFVGALMITGVGGLVVKPAVASEKKNEKKNTGKKKPGKKKSEKK